MVFQDERALDEGRCRQLIDIFLRHLDAAISGEGRTHPTLHCFHSVTDVSSRALLLAVLGECYPIVRREVATPRSIYPETMILAALGVGGAHESHADNCRQNAMEKWEPNHTPQRCYSTIYYLNSDFDGGEIAFQQRNLLIKPKRGLLLGFPSDRHHVHEVFPVRAGNRYSLAIWWTHRRDCAL